MFTSANDIFVSFLDGIRKTHTATVRPELFCRIWNQWAMPEWIDSNVSLKEGVELDQKQIDDLAQLIKIYRIPVETSSVNLFKKPNSDSTGIVDDLTGLSISTPKTYLRALKIGFKLNYGINQECGLSGESKWLPSTYMRSNMENVIINSVYRKPKDSRLYHKIIGDYIQMITDPDIGSPGISMKLEFVYYPNEMTYSSGFSYTMELPYYQLVEIVQIAVRLYLERVNSTRYASFFQEFMAKNIDKI